MNKLRILQLSGHEIPSFYQFIKESKNHDKVTAEVELTLNEWEEIPVEWKGSHNGKNHFLTFAKGTMVMTPVNMKGGEPESTELKDVVDAPVQPSEDAHTKDSQDVIDKVKAGKRMTDTSETGRDSTAATPETKTTFGDEKIEDCITETIHNSKEEWDKVVKEKGASSYEEDDNNIHAKDADGKKIGEFNKKHGTGLTGAHLKWNTHGKVEEKWKTDYETPENKKGMFDGKSKEDLESELAALKKSGPHKEGSAEFTKEKELMFALRAKSNWGKVEETTANSEKVIKDVEAGKRLTDTEETGTDSTAATPETKTTLGDETVEVNGKKVTKESVEAAERIIKSVLGHSPPHEVSGAKDTATPKADSTDYNKMIDSDEPMEDARDNVDNQEDLKDRDGVAQMQKSKMRVPSKVLSQLDQRINELKSAIAEYDDKGYNDGSVKQNAVDVLEKMKEHLKQGNLEGLKQATIYYGTLMSPITDLLPASLPVYLTTAANFTKTEV